MDKLNLTTSMEIPIINEGDGYFSSVDASFYNDWTVKIEFFHEGYDKQTQEVLGNETVPLFPLFVFAICPQCGKFLQDNEIEFLDEILEEDDISCYKCWEIEYDRELQAYADRELSEQANSRML